MIFPQAYYAKERTGAAASLIISHLSNHQRGPDSTCTISMSVYTCVSLSCLVKGEVDALALAPRCSVAGLSYEEVLTGNIS